MAKTFSSEAMFRLGPLNLFDPLHAADASTESPLCWVLNLEHKDARSVHFITNIQAHLTHNKLQYNNRTRLDA